MTTFRIAELFASIQGEGTLTGAPSAFIRTSGCNLRCHFCDTPYTSWDPQGERQELDEVVAAVRAFGPGISDAVITGGEPMVAKGIDELAAALTGAGYRVTVETAGTVYLPMPIALWSISPKLASSAPEASTGWRERHDARRKRSDVIMEMMASPGSDYQLKFVASSESDLDEIDAWVAEVGAPADHVWLMPEGTDVDALDRRAAWVVPAAMARGYRYCDRLHIRLFGDTPGT